MGHPRRPTCLVHGLTLVVRHGWSRLAGNKSHVPCQSLANYQSPLEGFFIGECRHWLANETNLCHGAFGLVTYPCIPTA